MPTENGTAFDNGITVHYDGRTCELALDAGEAQKFYDYACVAGDAPRDNGPYSKEEQEARGHRWSEGVKRAEGFSAQLNLLASLKPEELSRVFALIELMEFGKSWVLEIIENLLLDVQFEGPAKANESNPIHILSDIAHNLFDWWDDIDTAKRQHEAHPALFPSPVTQPATPQPTKAQRARKPRKKVSRAA